MVTLDNGDPGVLTDAMKVIDGLRARTAFITVEGRPVRFAVDQAESPTLPTATEGHLLPINYALELESPLELDRVRFIRAAVDEGDPDAVLTVTTGV
mgnify:CR=1 FL=1